MRTDVAFYLAVVAVVLIGAAWLVPGNPITGNAVLEAESCGVLGCSQLCDADEDCDSGMICCPTTWDAGDLCDYPGNCPVIADFSASGRSLEEYHELRTEEPQAIRNIGWGTFWLPMLIIAAICIGFIWQAKNKKL